MCVPVRFQICVLHIQPVHKHFSSCLTRIADLFIFPVAFLCWSVTESICETCVPESLEPWHTQPDSEKMPQIDKLYTRDKRHTKNDRQRVFR